MISNQKIVNFCPGLTAAKTSKYAERSTMSNGYDSAAVPALSFKEKRAPSTLSGGIKTVRKSGHFPKNLVCLWCHSRYDAPWAFYGTQPAIYRACANL